MWARAQAVEENITYSVTFPNNHTMTIIRDAQRQLAPPMLGRQRKAWISKLTIPTVALVSPVAIRPQIS
jgi:hypothetical protein